MKDIKLNTTEADNKVAAYLNARERSDAARALYSAIAQQRAADVFEAVRTTFIRSKCYLTFRNKFITVKVCKPSASDKLYADALEKELDAMGAKKVVTAQGITYRFV